MPVAGSADAVETARAPSGDDQIAISAVGLGKRFQIGTKTDARFFSQMLAWCSGITNTRPLWAVRGIDLQIRRGECVGVIGRNGSGKTTFLRMLAGVLVPTEGTLCTHGRISTFFSIGSGLFSELRVIDNIRLTAALCGMSRATLRQRFDAIVAFGELEDYLYSRLGELSTGFTSRVPLATALHSDIDILLTDEVFATGDTPFQTKCLAKMNELLRQGTTTVMASHSMALIKNNCSRAICLEHGAVAAQGPVAEVVQYYERQCGAAPAK